MGDSTTLSLFDESLRRVSGIYLIQHIANKKVYVGSTNDLYIRRRGHFSTLHRRCHKNEYLQNAYSKYGRKAFRFVVVEECALDVLIQREQHWIDSYQATDPKKGYNLCPFAGGRGQSEETRAKISKTLTGRVRTKEHCRNMSKANKGQASWSKGKKRSGETRRKMSEAAKGNKKFLGKKHSPETIEKMRAAQRERWARGKNYSKEARRSQHEKTMAYWTPERRAERAEQKRQHYKRKNQRREPLQRDDESDK